MMLAKLIATLVIRKIAAAARVSASSHRTPLITTVDHSSNLLVDAGSRRAPITGSATAAVRFAAAVTIS